MAILSARTRSWPFHAARSSLFRLSTLSTSLLCVIFMVRPCSTAVAASICSSRPRVLWSSMTFFSPEGPASSMFEPSFEASPPLESRMSWFTRMVPVAAYCLRIIARRSRQVRRACSSRGGGAITGLRPLAATTDTSSFEGSPSGSPSTPSGSSLSGSDEAAPTGLAPSGLLELSGSLAPSGSLAAPRGSTISSGALGGGAPLATASAASSSFFWMASRRSTASCSG